LGRASESVHAEVSDADAKSALREPLGSSEPRTCSPARDNGRRDHAFLMQAILNG
jgi:hypothetical protein